MKKIVLILSGGGTTADAVGAAWQANMFDPDAEIVGAISTVEGAKGLQKAEVRGIPTFTIARKEYSDAGKFEYAITGMLTKLEADIVFLLGCIHKIPIIPSVAYLNTHPADRCKHGGKGMYGLEVHRDVLRNALRDLERGWQRLGEGNFITTPTVHEAVEEYDQGAAILTGTVIIPDRIIILAQKELDEAAKQLQQIVLKNEYILIVTALNMLIYRLQASN